jgi:hypothetical protein
MLAEKQRRIREAEEAGLRQREENVRMKQDEVFREIAGVHATSVQTFLEDVLFDSTTVVADELARAEIRKKAKSIDKVAQMLHDDGIDQTELGALTIAADLVSSFMLPEAARKVKRAAVQAGQRRFLVGAHRELLDMATAAEHRTSIARQASLTGTTTVGADEEEEEDGDGTEAEGAGGGAMEAAADTTAAADAAAADVAAIDLEDADVQAAATTIQAGFKGMQARKRVKAMQANQHSSQHSAVASVTQQEALMVVIPEMGQVGQVALALAGDEVPTAGSAGPLAGPPDAAPALAPAPTQLEAEAEVDGAVAAVAEEDPATSLGLEGTADEEAAAAKIQAGFRGMQVRKEMAAKKDAAAE